MRGSYAPVRALRGRGSRDRITSSSSMTTSVKSSPQRDRRPSSTHRPPIHQPGSATASPSEPADARFLVGSTWEKKSPADRRYLEELRDQLPQPPVSRDLSSFANGRSSGQSSIRSCPPDRHSVTGPSGGIGSEVQGRQISPRTARCSVQSRARSSDLDAPRIMSDSDGTSPAVAGRRGNVSQPAISLTATGRPTPIFWLNYRTRWSYQFRGPEPRTVCISRDCIARLVALLAMDRRSFLSNLDRTFVERPPR